MAESLERIDPQFHSLKRLDPGSSAISDLSVAIPCADSAPAGSGVLSEIDALFRQMLGASEEVLAPQTSALSAEDREKIAAMRRSTQRLRGLFGELLNARQQQADASHTSSNGRNSLTTADRLAFVLSAAQLGDWSWDPVTDVMELSARAAEIFEVPAGSRFTRTELRELLHENDRERARLAAEYSARTQTDYDIEYQINLRSGRRRWVAAKGRPLLTGDGRLCGMLGLVQDITQRKQAEEALKDTRARLDATLGAAEIGTWTWNLRSNRVIADKNLAHMFFGPETDVSEGPIENFLEMIHPEDRGRAHADITAAIESATGELETDYRLVSPDGRIRWVTVRGKVQRDASGLPVQFPGVLIDITERKRQEAALAELSRRMEDQARLFDATLSNIADLAYAFDRDKRVIYANKALLELWGVSLDQAVGKNCYELNYPPELARQLEAQMQKVFDTKKPVKDVTFYAGDYHEYIYSPASAPDGSVTAMVGTTRIITERKRVEVALQEAKDAAEAAGLAKDRFLAVLSHELRTPLTPVLMTITALEADTELPFAIRDDLAMIRRNVELETKLIDDLLDLSRITSGKLRLKLESVDLNETIRQVCEICSSQILEKNIRLNVELNPESAHVIADPARLQQVFWNVLKNAVKFTSEHRSITVTTGRSASGRVQVKVRDCGIGIERDKLSRIFDAFEQGDPKITRQFGGLGLGLAISKALVEMHHGSIWAESEGFGRGSTFTIELPLKEAVPESVAVAPESGATHKPASLRLLLVEDHVDTARTLGRLLRRSGYTVKSAGTITAALELAANEPFDVLVSDLGLPDGTGYELMQQIRERYAMRGIAMSGFGMEEDIRRSKEAGFSEHLVKPLSIPQLQQALSRVGEQL